MKTLNFYNIKDKKPDDYQEIFYIDVRPFYGTVEPSFGVAEYCWFEYDAEGLTGNQISYDPDVPIPDGCKLHIMIGNRIIDLDNFWWTEAENLDQFV